MDNLIYHYTSFEKLQCILKYGTLRFKESTSSNDILDTIGFVNILKEMPHFSASNATSALLNFIIEYYQRETYTPSAKFLVACFSKIPDSRLLWDAYTMHRPGNQKCSYGEDKYCYEATSKYNGVCIAFKQNSLKTFLHTEEGKKYDKSYLQSIVYGNTKIKILLNEWLKEAAFKSIMLGKDEDQSQDIIPPLHVIGDKYIYFKKSLVIPTLEFMQNVEAYSPFFKHEFWHEEEEVRASLLISDTNSSKYDVLEYADGTKYYDLEIPADCINHIILGPEFDSRSFEIIDAHPEYKFHLRDFALRTSLGTGVIRNQ